MDKSILMQKQVKDNAEDMQKEFLDMKNWEEQMKRKDEDLRKEASGQINLPPIRKKSVNKVKSVPSKENGTNKPKRIRSHDYSSWDKFDVDKACKEIDKDEQSDGSVEETMSKEELEKAHKVATDAKMEGNNFVKCEKWADAVQSYNKAIKAFPYDATFYANRALCHLKLKNFHSAESDCTAAINLDETYVKAYHRRATARMNLEHYKVAKQDLEMVLKLDPTNKETKSLLAQIEKKMKDSNSSTTQKEKTMAKTSEEKKIDIKSIPGTSKTIIKDTKDSQKNAEVNKTVNVEAVTSKQKETNSHIPDWLPEKNDVVIVEPITRPAHLRSKKSLKKIPVEEVDFSSIKTRCNIDKKTSSSHIPVKLETSNTEKNIKSKDIEEAGPSQFTDMPPIPKIAVQFIMTWKTNKSSVFRYKYLKQLPENNLPKIFRDSMESDIFSEILEVLRIEFVKRGDPVFSFLKDLSEVKRFRALIMFVSNKDKESLKILFEYCVTKEKVPLDDVKLLEAKYEM